jgi:1-acyl-sn-glycerol-3-phosphate acyltransferase
MDGSNLAQPKPITRRLRPEITRLPPLDRWRRLARHLLRGLARLLVWLFIRLEKHGLENVPQRGPALIITNHLGDADVVLLLAAIPCWCDALAKADLYDFPVLGKLMDAYGVIWVHRGQPDRRALRAALQGLKEGRVIGIAPEGRESLTGSLEEGTHGAAYLALKGDAPLIPVTFTGTENRRIYGNMKRLRRTPVTVTVGAPFRLEAEGDWHTAVECGTQTIMQVLARLLPQQYRGVYGEEA